MIEFLDRPRSVITPDYPYPSLIQGGMGVWVSNDRLSRNVAIATEKLEQAGKLREKTLGVVSLTGMPSVFVHKLQERDPDFLNALEHFPVPEIKDCIKEKYVGKVDPTDEIHFRLAPKPQDLLHPNPEKRKEIAELTIASSFAAVWLAKQGHNSPIGVNVLEKIQLSHLHELLGAMMAGADYVLVGAGIPTRIPAILDSFSKRQTAYYNLDVEGLSGRNETYEMSLDPTEYIPERYLGELVRPRFLAIVSSDTLAHHLSKKALYVDGFIVEDRYAGGHNAPSRDKNSHLNYFREPIYVFKDEITPEVIENILKLGKPTWLAGGRAGLERLLGAKALGATGVQVGSIFADCEESGFLPEIKEASIRLKYREELIIFANPVCSPSGYPFQVEQLQKSLSNPKIYNARERQCLYGYLVQAYRINENTIGFRCPAEPIDAYVAKGGKVEDIAGKVCLCTALLAAVGCGRTRLTSGGIYKEPYLVTSGKRYDFMKALAKREDGTITAEEVIKFEFGIK